MGSPRPTLGTALLPGVRLGRYELVQSVALGGMAEIYLARTQGPQRFEKYVILKRILPNLAADERFVEMFLDEARLAASMSHSNIVQVHDFGEVDGSYFFTMEYVHGEDARQILKTCRRQERRMSIGDAITIVSNAAAGLHYAHQLEGPDGKPLGIVHRDVSPSNILITFDGTVKVADFGIAKATQRAFSTRSGTVKGKVSYMSPEQCEGEALDCRADVFSLAIVLYELTTGHKLFGGENDLATMRRIIEKDAPRPSQVMPDYPPALEHILMRALARKREQRHASALELQTDLEQFCRSAGHVISAPSLATTMTSLFGKRPHPWSGQRQPSVITMEANRADWDAESKPTSQVPSSSKTSLSAIASEVALMPSVPAKKRSVGWIALGGVALAAVAAVAFVVVTRQESAEPSAAIPAPETVQMNTAPVAAPTPAPVEAKPAEQPTVPAAEPMVAEPTAPAVEPTAAEPTAPAAEEPTVPAAEPTVVAASPKPTTKPVIAKTKPRAKPVARKPVAAKPAKPAPPPEPAKPKPARDIDSPFLPK